MKVVISAQAEDDLSALRYWIGEDNPSRADSFLDELEAKIADLEQWLLRFPVAFQCSAGLVHRRVHRGYRILYVVNNDPVEVLHVHHGSRDVPTYD